MFVVPLFDVWCELTLKAGFIAHAAIWILAMLWWCWRSDVLSSLLFFLACGIGLLLTLFEHASTTWFSLMGYDFRRDACVEVWWCLCASSQRCFDVSRCDRCNPPPSLPSYLWLFEYVHSTKHLSSMLAGALVWCCYGVCAGFIPYHKKTPLCCHIRKDPRSPQIVALTLLPPSRKY